MEAFLLENWLLFLPILLINFGIVIFCIIDLLRTDRVIRGPKLVWILAIIFVNPMGWIAYLIFAKGE